MSVTHAAASPPEGPGPNFELYKARDVERTYLIVSTSSFARGQSPPKLRDRYDPCATGALADEIIRVFRAGGGKAIPATLRVHGFNTRRKDFEKVVLTEADPRLDYTLFSSRNPPAAFDPDLETFRPGNRFYFGYRWPSEGVGTRGSLIDTLAALSRPPVVGGLLLLFPILALFPGASIQRFLELHLPRIGAATRAALDLLAGWRDQLTLHAPALVAFFRTLALPYHNAIIAAALLGAGLLFLALRVSTYLRDRERALHHGVPDLGEFLRDLEEKLEASIRAEPDHGSVRERMPKLRFDIIGHSMGALLLINALRVLSDYFHGQGALGPGPEDLALGRWNTYRLRALVLCAPDIPVAMATRDRNNYFLSALRRFEATHVFGSDRDIILKWLSSLANWASEPRFDLAGRKLGNAHLVRLDHARLGRPDSRSDWTLWPVTRPVVEEYPVYPEDPLWQRRPAELQYHDCSLDPHVSGSVARLTAVTAGLVVLVAWSSRLPWRAPFAWLLAVVIVFLVGGLIARLLWPWARERGRLGGWIGFLTDFTGITAFATGANPHDGYFFAGSEPRRRIAEILRRDGRARRAEGRDDPEEADGAIRWRVVRISV